MILYLVSKGADVKAVNREGKTTVDMANGPVQRIAAVPRDDRAAREAWREEQPQVRLVLKQLDGRSAEAFALTRVRAMRLQPTLRDFEARRLQPYALSRLPARRCAAAALSAQSAAPRKAPAPRPVASHQRARTPAGGAPAALSPDAQNALVSHNCSTCHDDEAKTGGLSLENFDAATIDQRPEIAEKMIRKLRAGMMPPAGAGRPDAGALTGVRRGARNEDRSAPRPRTRRPAAVRSSV